MRPKTPVKEPVSQPPLLPPDFSFTSLVAISMSIDAVEIAPVFALATRVKKHIFPVVSEYQ